MQEAAGIRNLREALRYLDRNAVRAGLVEDPTRYPWSSCAAYALGTPNLLITFHPSYLALSSYPKVRQRQYRGFLAPGPDPDSRYPRSSLEYAAGHRDGSLRRPVHPEAWPPKTCFRATANSCTWRLEGVRYFLHGTSCGC